MAKQKTSLELHNKEDSLYKETSYYSDRTIKSDGNKISGQRIGDWKEYHPNGEVSRLLQYFMVDNESYLNQITMFDEKGDAIYGQGNYYETKLEKNDSIYSLTFWLTEPHLLVSRTFIF